MEPILFKSRTLDAASDTTGLLLQEVKTLGMMTLKHPIVYNWKESLSYKFQL